MAYSVVPFSSPNSPPRLLESGWLPPPDPGARDATVRGEGVQEVLAWPAPAGRTMLDPEHWARQVWQTAGEMLPDHLGGQVPRHLPRSDASDPGELLAHDHGGVALGAFVDPDPAASGPEPVARPVMHVLVREVHLISQPAFYRVTPRQARSNSCSISGLRPAAGSLRFVVVARSQSSTSSIVSDKGRKVSPASIALLQSTASMAAYSRGTHRGSSVNGSTPFSSMKSSDTQTGSAPAPPTASHSSSNRPIRSS